MERKISLFVLILIGGFPLFAAAPEKAVRRIISNAEYQAKQKIDQEYPPKESRQERFSQYMASMVIGGFTGLGFAEWIKSFQNPHSWAPGKYALTGLGLITGGYFCHYIRQQNSNLEEKTKALEILAQKNRELEGANIDFQQRITALEKKVIRSARSNTVNNDSKSYCAIL